MRKMLLVGSAILIAGCGQSEEKRSAENLKTFDVAEAPPPMAQTAPPPMAPPPPPPPPLVRSSGESMESADGAGPDVSVTAAPGVAFNYRYAYRLNNARIQAAQEAHAQMCEKLTVARCRITGMRYSLTGERDISASLEMKLDPTLARQFGKDATRVVTDAEGMLVDQQISGTDMAPTIEGANRGRAELQDQLDRLNRELGRPGLSSAVRERLLSEASQVNAEMRSLSSQRQAAEDSLATTPIAFYYGSGETVPGFDDQRPIVTALQTAGDNFLGVIGFLIVALGTLLPIALLAGLAIWLWRRLGVGRWLARKSEQSYAKEA